MVEDVLWEKGIHVRNGVKSGGARTGKPDPRPDGREMRRIPQKNSVSKIPSSREKKRHGDLVFPGISPKRQDPARTHLFGERD